MDIIIHVARLDWTGIGSGSVWLGRISRKEDDVRLFLVRLLDAVDTKLRDPKETRERQCPGVFSLLTPWPDQTKAIL